MQNTGNFKHFHIARFDASLKYVILKCLLKKSVAQVPLRHFHLSFCWCSHITGTSFILPRVPVVFSRQNMLQYQTM